MFFTARLFFSCNVLNVNSLKCVSMNNEEYRARLEIININSNEPLLYPYSILSRWNDAQSLLMNMVCTSCLTSYWTT